MFDDPEISDDDDADVVRGRAGGFGSGPGMSRMNFSSGQMNLDQVGLDSPPGRDSPAVPTSQYSGYPAQTNFYTGSSVPSAYMNNSALSNPATMEIRYGNAERDLAKDAQWKITQNYTFSRWMNAQLKPVLSISFLFIY